MAWVFYFIAWVIFMFTSYPVAGFVALSIGALFHWKWWLAGIVAFFVGFSKG